jgi:mono/diheme cytochrome c family protein
MRRLLKWAVRIVVGIVAVAALAYGFLAFRASGKMEKQYAVTPEQVAIPAADSAVLAEGRRLANVYCAHCHDSDLGGRRMIDGPLARLDSLNLTAGHGSGVAGYTDADWVRTIRHGVKKDGRSLMVMPSGSFWHLSDEDLGAIVAYLKSAPPVDRDVTARELRPLGTVLVGLGAFDGEFPAAVIDHAAPRPAPPAKGASIAYGEYMVRSFGCTICHGQDLGGQKPPDPESPYAPNLTQAGALRAFNEDSFLGMARTRDTAGMPWSALRAMNDDELRSVWRYLSSMPVVDRPAPPAKTGA